MKRKLIASILFVSMSLSLFGCSNSTKDNVKTTDVTGTESSGESVGGETGEVVEIRFANWDGGTTLEAYQKVIDAFNETHPGIKVTNLNIPSEYDTKVTAMVAGGDAPEIAVMESGTILFPLSEENALCDINDFIKEDSEYDPSQMMESIQYMDGEKLVGYGIGAESMGMFYNPELFEKYDVPLPPADYENAWDWDTFVDYAKQLTIDKNGKNAKDPDFDPNRIDVYGVNFGKWWGVWMPFLYSSGLDYLSEDEQSIGLAQPEAAQIIQNLADLIHVHHVSPSPTSSEALPGLSEAIMTGKVAMSIDGQWNNANLMDDEVEYGVGVLPKMGETARTTITVGCLSIFDTPKKDAAWEFFKFLNEPEAVVVLQQSGVWLPTNTVSYEEENLDTWITDKHPENQFTVFAKPIIDGTANSPVPLYVKNFNKINDIINPALDLVWTGEQSAEEAIKGVAETANAQVQGYR